MAPLMGMMSVGELILKSAGYLAKKGVETPRLDAELLLAHVMNCDRLRLYMDWPKPVTELEVSGYREYIRRRGQDREPVARIIGKKPFFGRDFALSRDSFVPRPETEHVVERALDILRTEEALSRDRQTVFEVGTGSGCIVVTLAAEADGHHFIASDVLDGALETARANARKHKVESRIDFRKGPLLAGWEGPIGLLVSNPPYIERNVIPTLDPEVRVYDPMPALDGGVDGLDVVRELVPLAKRQLIRGGWVVLELGENQPAKAAELFREAGGFESMQCEEDLAGLERYLLVRRSQS